MRCVYPCCPPTWSGGGCCNAGPQCIAHHVQSYITHRNILNNRVHVSQWYPVVNINMWVTLHTWENVRYYNINIYSCLWSGIFRLQVGHFTTHNNLHIVQCYRMHGWVQGDVHWPLSGLFILWQPVLSEMPTLSDRLHILISKKQTSSQQKIDDNVSLLICVTELSVLILSVMWVFWGCFFRWSCLSV